MSGRTGWAAAAAVLASFTAFEVVKYGGWAWGAAAVGLIAPDLVMLGGIGATPAARGVLPRRIIPAYNLVHRPVGPVLLMLAVGVAPITHAAFVPWFVLGLAWLAHICLDRALGLGLRASDGSVRGAKRDRRGPVRNRPHQPTPIEYHSSGPT